MKKSIFLSMALILLLVTGCMNKTKTLVCTKDIGTSSIDMTQSINIKFIDDKVVLKYFKKFMNRNSEKDLKPLLIDLQKKIQNPKTPHVDKIKKALELFEKRNEPLY